MEFAAIIFVAGVSGFIGGFLASRGWKENDTPRLAWGIFFIALGCSSGIWIPLLHWFGK